MSKLIQREVEFLNKKLLALGAVVEESLRLAVDAVTRRDADLARRMIDNDEEIDRMEVDLEEECLKTLALHQPVANDLRFIIAVLKINNDLERVGDLAANIAERALLLASHPPLTHAINLETMADRVQDMLRRSLDALVKEDTDLAEQVLAADDDVDRRHREIFAQIEAAIRANPDQIQYLLPYLSISRNLERVADHATNIAEDVIYVLKGEIVRHRHAPGAGESDRPPLPASPSLPSRR